MTDSVFGSPFSAPPEEDLRQLPVSEANSLLMGGPVALVTTIWRGEPNVIPISWFTPLSSDPALVGIAIEQSRYSTDILGHASEFALNIPTRSLASHVEYLGSLSGADLNKFEATQLETFAARRISSPLISLCCAWIECEIVERLELGDHYLFVGSILSAQCKPNLVSDHDEDYSLRPLHYLGAQKYSVLQKPFEPQIVNPSEAPEDALSEMLEEQLELSREAIEKKEERLGKLEDEVERGNVVDLREIESELGLTLEAGDELDLSRGILFDGDSERE